MRLIDSLNFLNLGNDPTLYVHNDDPIETNWSKRELAFELKLHMQRVDGGKASLLQRYQSYKALSHAERAEQHAIDHGDLAPGRLRHHVCAMFVSGAAHDPTLPSGCDPIVG